MKSFLDINRLIPSPLGAIPDRKSANRKLLSIAVPSIVELVLVSLIGSVDLMMVGKEMGDSALSAVNLCNQPLYIALFTLWAICSGITATVARRKGQDDSKGAAQVLCQSMTLIIIVQTITFIIMQLIAHPLLVFCNAKGQTLKYAETYFRIILIGSLTFRGPMLAVNAALRAVGEAKTTMITNVASNIVNIILNYLLIGGRLGCPKLGVAGAAIASNIGMLAAVIIALHAVTKGDSYIKISVKSSYKPQKTVIAPVLRVGINNLIEQSAIRVSFILIASMTMALGDSAFAAHSITQQVAGWIYNVGAGLAVGTTSLVGQSLGAERADLAYGYTRLSVRFAFILSLICQCITLCGITVIPRLFSDDRQTIHTAMLLLLIYIVIMLPEMIQIIYSGMLRGAGDTFSVAVSAIIFLGIIRTVLTYFAIYIFNLGIYGVWLAVFVDEIGRMAVLKLRFKSGVWKTIKV